MKKVDLIQCSPEFSTIFEIALLKRTIVTNGRSKYESVMAILPVTDAGEIAKAPQENSWPFVSERRSWTII